MCNNTKNVISVAILTLLLVSTAQAGLNTNLKLYSSMDGATPIVVDRYWQDTTANGYDVNNVAAPAYDGSGDLGGTNRGTAVDFFNDGNPTLNLDKMTVHGGYDADFDPGTTDYSVSMWYQETAAGAFKFFLNNGSASGSTDPGFALCSLSGEPAIRLNDAGGAHETRYTIASGLGDISSAGWHHLVAVFDRSGAHSAANTASLYVDGSCAGSAVLADVGGNPYDIANSSRQLYMGGPGHTTGCDFEGYLDDVAVYRGALSPANVTTLYGASGLNSNTITSAGITPVALHPFETNIGGGGSLGTVPDDHINGYDGALHGVTVAPVTDPTRGDVLQFGGRDSQYADYGDKLDPGTGSYTASVWFKTDDVTPSQFVMGKGNATSATLGWSVFVEGGIVYTRACYDDRNPEGLDFRLSVAHDVTADEWHHLALVIDNTGGVLKGYLDGLGSGGSGTDNGWTVGGGGGVTNTFASGQTFDVDESLRLGIGYLTGIPFDGLVDDFAVWDRVLSDAEILSIYNGAEIGGSGDLLPGDADGSGTVNHLDAAIVAANWLQAGNWGDGDFNNDGIVDDVDATMMAANWLMSNSAGASVPEPSTLALLASALAAVLLLIRKKR